MSDISTVRPNWLLSTAGDVGMAAGSGMLLGGAGGGAAAGRDAAQPNLASPNKRTGDRSTMGPVPTACARASLAPSACGAARNAGIPHDAVAESLRIGAPHGGERRPEGRGAERDHGRRSGSAHGARPLARRQGAARGGGDAAGECGKERPGARDRVRRARFGHRPAGGESADRRHPRQARAAVAGGHRRRRHGWRRGAAVPYRAPVLGPGQERSFRSALASTIANRIATGKTNASQLAQAGGRIADTSMSTEAGETEDVPGATGLSPPWRARCASRTSSARRARS
jgi:hypothetical protein